MKVLIVHANFSEFGGAELYGLRIVKILLSLGHDVSIAHCGPPLDDAKLESWTGITLSDVKFIESPLLAALNKTLGKFSLLRFAAATAVAKRRAKEYDAVISTYGEYPDTKNTLYQFIHVPLYLTDAQALAHIGFASKGYKRFGRNAYVKFCRLLAGWDKSKVESNTSFANSNWTRAEFIKAYSAAKCSTIYIGASTKRVYFEELTYDEWSRRENCVALIGRVVANKRLTLALEFLRLVNLRADSKLKLKVIGKASEEYKSTFEDLIRDNPSIEWIQDAPRDVLESEASRCKWGLHCAQYEHYGLAAIELQRLGCLTFVPNSSGQAELSEEPKYRFDSVEELVEKFLNIESDEEEIKRFHLHRIEIIKKHQVGLHDSQMTRFFEDSLS